MTVTRKGLEAGPKSWMLAIGVGRITVPVNAVGLVAAALLLPSLAGGLWRGRRSRRGPRGRREKQA